MRKDTLKDGRESGFFIIDNELIDRYGAIIGVYGVAVYNVLAQYANKNGNQVFPSYNTIADKLGISRPKVISTIAVLVDAGLITKAKRVDKAGDMTSNEYTLSSLKGGKSCLPPSKQDLPPSKQGLPQVVNGINQGGKQRLPDQDPINKTQLDQDDHLPGMLLRSMIEGAGFMYFDKNFMEVACKLEADYTREQLIRALQATQEAHQKKTSNGERGITAPLAYMKSVLIGDGSNGKPHAKAQPAYKSPLKGMKIYTLDGEA